MHIGQWDKQISSPHMRQMMVVEGLRLAMSQVSKGVIYESYLSHMGKNDSFQ